jgi:TonB dependent receptor-like, beta-barrel
MAPPASYLPRIEPSEVRYQFQEGGTYTTGNHTIKFGADIATTRDYVYYISNAFGSYTYQTVNAFALDYSGATAGAKDWQRYVQTFGNAALDYRISDFGFYLQDQWRVTDRFTVMYGVRYDYAKLPQPSVCNHDYPGTCHVPSQPTNLAPRLGLTYRLNDKTVLQAGYGMFYARFQGGSIDNLFTTGNGLYQTGITLNNTSATQLAAGPVFPNALSSIPAGATVSAASLQFLAPNLKTPYSEQGNVGIQRQLSRDIAMTVSYVWSRGVQLYGIRDINMPSTTTNFTYTINDANGNAAGTYTTPVYVGVRPDSRYGGIYYDENGVNSYYNGMTVQVNKRFAHGLQGLLSYTWSHEIDDGESYGESTNNLFLSNANYWLYNGNYKADKGSGTLDQRQRLVFSWMWELPKVSRTDVLSKYVVNGWQLSSITSMASGHPYGNVTINVTDTPVPGMFSNYSVTGSGFSYRAPWTPANSYYLPARYKADVRLTKMIPVGERCKLSLNFEAFNIANTWAATGFTSSQGYTEAKGVITPTPTKLYIPSSDGGFPDGTQARRLQASLRFIF